MEEDIDEVYQDVYEIYTDPKRGYTSVNDIHRKLNGKYTMQEVDDAMKKISSYTTNKRNITSTTFSSYKSRYPFEIVQGDLTFFTEWKNVNDDLSCALVIIDVFTRYAFVRFMKGKTGEEVAKNLQDIYNEITTLRQEHNILLSPAKIQTDKGKEFYNTHVKKLLKTLNVEIYSIESQWKAAIVERFNRTLKERLIKYTSEKQTRRYVDVIQDIVYNYNNTYHATLQCTPTEAFTRAEPSIPKYPNRTHRVFNVNDLVRVTQDKHIFGKEIHNQKYTIEIFIVKEVHTDKDKNRYYKLKDRMDEDVVGVFYGNDLVGVDKSVLDQKFLIDKVIKREKTRSLVSFMGYPSKFDRWIDNKDLSFV